MTKIELEHLSTLKNWSAEVRKNWDTIKASRFWPALKRISPQAEESERLFDNIDWLIATLEREHSTLRHRQGVKGLMAAVDKAVVQ